MPKKANTGFSDEPARSWFVVLNNPEKYGYTGSPEEICNQLRDEWVASGKGRVGMWAYCHSAKDLGHVHMVLESPSTMRFSAIKKSYPKAHLEPTKGTKKQAEDYIYKRPPFDEKGESIMCVVKAGEIQGNQGYRSDLKQIDDLLKAGFKPSEIFRENIAFRRYERMIKNAFFDMRKDAVPPKRTVHVHLLVGPSGSGKSYTYVDLCEKYGEDNVYFMTDYALNGGFDYYSAESILFMDEYKAQLPYAVLLNILDGYKAQVHSRYGNAWSLWNDVYITTIFSPEKIYDLTVPPSLQATDTFAQLFRRFDDITYCCRSERGEYKKYSIPMSKYKGWELFVEEATHAINRSSEQLVLTLPESGKPHV